MKDYIPRLTITKVIKIIGEFIDDGIIRGRMYVTVLLLLTIMFEISLIISLIGDIVLHR